MKRLISVLALSTLLTLGSFAMANATAENTAIEPQMLTEQEMATVTGGDLCIECGGDVSITFTSYSVTVECDWFIAVYFC